MSALRWAKWKLSSPDRASGGLMMSPTDCPQGSNARCKTVEADRFREDLYYRLNGFHIYIPPLRERQDDILPLAEHFYREACRDQERKLDGFGSGVLDMLASYPWPGNVRELRNEIHRAYVLAGEGLPIQMHHFSSQITKGESLIQEVLSEQLSLSASLKRLQRRMVEDALRESGGNRTQAAKRLGMDTANLRHLIKRLRIKA
jgi:transcriptional regulator with GAF, ATPase, and Fis domain